MIYLSIGIEGVSFTEWMIWLLLTSGVAIMIWLTVSFFKELAGKHTESLIAVSKKERKTRKQAEQEAVDAEVIEERRMDF